MWSYYLTCKYLLQTVKTVVRVRDGLPCMEWLLWEEECPRGAPVLRIWHGSDDGKHAERGLSTVP